MSDLHLQILTPRKAVFDEEVTSVTVPATSGELTILPQHTKLLTTLKEGIVTIRKGKSEDFLAIGGGYLETDGKELRVLVSRAYRQDEIDEEQTKRAIDQAKKVMEEAPDLAHKQEVFANVRRAIIDMKLLKKRRKTSTF